MIKKLIENRINSFVEKVLSERKDEINSRITKEINLYEAEQEKAVALKKEGFSKSSSELDTLILEKDNLIKRIDEEKSRLSNTLNIVNQNLTAHDIWMKLWTIAFDKAMDICWDLQKDNTKKLIEITRQRALEETRENTQSVIENHNKNVEEQLKNMNINKMSIINARNEAYKSYLIYNKTGDKAREAFYDGQLDLIERILNDKKA